MTTEVNSSGNSFIRHAKKIVLQPFFTRGRVKYHIRAILKVCMLSQEFPGGLLRLGAFTDGAQVQALVWELRSHIKLLQAIAKKIKIQ